MMAWTSYWTTGGGSAQPAYYQIQFNGCAVGCGPTAWTMLFCWGDYQSAHGNAYWAPRNGLYRQNGGRGADAVAPLIQDAGVENVMRELNGEVHTFCIFGSGATAPWDMPGAWSYLNGRTGTAARADWNSVGICQDWLRDRAIESIVNRHTPAVIGTGWLIHYPMAFGYAWQTRTVRHSVLWWSWDETVTDRCFYVNEGWGGGGAGDWVDASTWFAGQIYP
jgi:hypothetical protein